MPISIPIQLNQGILDRTDDERESIKQFLQLLVSSYQGCFEADKEFGFSFINHRFENICDKVNNFWHKDLKFADAGKKIRDNSKNSDTFAIDLKESIEKYEPRLTDISVNVTCETKEKKATVTINGKYHGERVTQKIDIYLW